MPRYVILEHDHPTRHWDFMLEAGAVLRTWRLAAPPRAGHPVAAAKSFDHRIRYLDYEGPVSGGRGSIMKWDHGTFIWQVDEPNRVVVALAGTRLKGVAVLELGEGGDWRLEWLAPEQIR